MRRPKKNRCEKSFSAEKIAEDLAEDNSALIQKIMDTAKSFAPEYNIDEIYDKVVQ